MKIIIKILILFFVFKTVKSQCYGCNDGLCCGDAKNIEVNLFGIGNVKYFLEKKTNGYIFDYKNFPLKDRLCDLQMVRFGMEITNFPKVPTVGGSVSFDANFICNSFGNLKKLSFNGNQEILVFNNETTNLSVVLPQGCGPIKINGKDLQNFNAFYEEPRINNVNTLNRNFNIEGSNLFGTNIEIISNSGVTKPTIGQLSIDHRSISFPFPESEYQGLYNVSVSICNHFQVFYLFTFNPTLFFENNKIITKSGGLITFSGKNLKVRNNVKGYLNGDVIVCTGKTSTFSTIQCAIPPLGIKNAYDVPFFIKFDERYITNSIRVSFV